MCAFHALHGTYKKQESPTTTIRKNSSLRTKWHIHKITSKHLKTPLLIYMSRFDRINTKNLPSQLHYTFHILLPVKFQQVNHNDWHIYILHTNQPNNTYPFLQQYQVWFHLGLHLQIPVQSLIIVPERFNQLKHQALNI